MLSKKLATTENNNAQLARLQRSLEVVSDGRAGRPTIALAVTPQVSLEPKVTAAALRKSGSYAQEAEFADVTRQGEITMNNELLYEKIGRMRTS